MVQWIIDTLPEFEVPVFSNEELEFSSEKLCSITPGLGESLIVSVIECTFGCSNEDSLLCLSTPEELLKSVLASDKWSFMSEIEEFSSE